MAKKCRSFSTEFKVENISLVFYQSYSMAEL